MWGNEENDWKVEDNVEEKANEILSCYSGAIFPLVCIQYAY